MRMQRYSAGEFPKRPAEQQACGQDTPIGHAVLLGRYILEQRGKEGAACYLTGLRPVLPDGMLREIAARLCVPMPQEPEKPPCPPPPPSPPSCPQQKQNVPDMETLVQLMQLLGNANGGNNGSGGPDVKALLKLMGK